jgi:hypothetical protein
MGIFQLTSRLQTGSTHKEAVDITLLGQLTTVLLAYTTSVDDASRFSDFW